MNRNQIYHDLGFSIRKVNKDEIEIKNSTFDGYLRGFFRTLIIGIFSVIAFLDIQDNQIPLSSIYEGIKYDYLWALNPDEQIKPMYNLYVLHDGDPTYFQRYPEKYPPESYEEFRKPYVTEDFWKRHVFYFELIPIFLVFILFFYPRHRSIRLNRKERVVYMQAFHKIFVIPVPDKGDPLMGMKYTALAFICSVAVNSFRC